MCRAALVLLAFATGCGRISYDDRDVDAAAADALAPGVCPRDEFLALDSDVWRPLDPASPHTVTVDQGYATVTLAPGAPGYAANGLATLRPIDFTDATLVVVVSENVNQSGYAEQYAQLYIDDSNYVEISAGAGTTSMIVRLAGTIDRSDTTFDATTYWRIRHHASAGTMELDRSTDGVTWLPSFTSLFSVSTSSMRVSLLGGTYLDGGNPTPGRVRYDRISVTGPGCP